MKTRRILLTSMGVMSLIMSEAFALDLNVAVPGTLKDLILDTDEDFSNLTLSGTLDASDVEYLTGNNGKIMQVKHLEIGDLKLVEDENVPYRNFALYSEAGGGIFAYFYYSQNKRVEESYGVGGLGMPITYLKFYGTDLAGLLGKTQFENVSLPAIDNKVADYICFQCQDLKTVSLPDNAEFIGNGAFSSCYALENVNIPSSLKTIGDNAFDFTKLKEVVLPATLTTIGNSAFANTSDLTDINLEKVTAIGSYAFSQSKISIINIPNVTVIPEYAFSACPVTELVLSDKLREIGEGAFALGYPDHHKDYNLITEIALPDGLERIGGDAFIYTHLLEVSVPNSVSYIGQNAFKYTPWDSNLKGEDGVVYLGTVAYKSVNRPEVIDFREGTTSISANFDMTYTKSFTLPSSVVSIYSGDFYYNNLESCKLNEGLKIIGDKVFQYAGKLTSIDLPSTLEYIGSGAFCSTGLTSLTLPENLKVIESKSGISSTFGYSRIPSLTLPANLEEIGEDAFAYCEALSTVKIESRNLNYTGYRFRMSEYQRGLLFAASGIEKIVIGKDVTAIPSGMFGTQYNLALIEFEESDLPLTIGHIALGANYVNPAKVKGSINRIVEIGDYALNNLEFAQGTSFDFPKIKSIGTRAFENISGVQELILNNGIEKLGNGIGSFSDLRKLVYNVPDAVYPQSDGYTSTDPLLYISNPIDSIVIGSDVEVIAPYLFSNMESNNVTFMPRSQTRAASTLSIGKYSFFFNKGLYAVDFPKEVSSIGEKAFGDCDNLATVYFHSETAPEAGAESFGRNATIYVPADAEASYKASLPGNNIQPYRLESLMLDKSALFLAIGGGDYLIARITPAECSEMEIEWTTSNPAVATVNTRGDVVGVGEGKAVISATIAMDSSFRAECNVTVSESGSVEDMEAVADSSIVAYYTLSGMRIEGRPEMSGVYVAIHADGTRSKVMVK